MTKLVFITQTLDPADPALAQTLDLVGALAARTDELVVLSRYLRWDAVPPNVTVRLFDANAKYRRALAFQRALVPALHGADAVIVHMVPQFLLLAAAPARLRRVPLLLWYTHWHASRSLRTATALANLVLSVDRASFPLESPKVLGIGHAIDVGMFNAEPPSSREGPLRLLVIGRTARWKGIATLLRAMSIVIERGVDVSLEVRGPSLNTEEVAHRAELARLIEDDPHLRGRVRLADAVARSELPKLFASVDAVVSPNEPRSGATFDKAVFEAAACARPVVSTNEAFAPLLGGLELPLLAPPSDPPALADALVLLAAASSEERARVGLELRSRVVAGHSLDHWADAVIAAVGEVRSPRGG